MKITSDLHIHTNLSLCADSGATMENYLAECGKKGIKASGEESEKFRNLTRRNVE